MVAVILIKGRRQTKRAGAYIPQYTRALVLLTLPPLPRAPMVSATFWFRLVSCEHRAASRALLLARQAPRAPRPDDASCSFFTTRAATDYGCCMTLKFSSTAKSGETVTASGFSPPQAAVPSGRAVRRGGFSQESSRLRYTSNTCIIRVWSTSHQPRRRAHVCIRLRSLSGYASLPQSTGARSMERLSGPCGTAALRQYSARHDRHSSEK